jgi:orotate phosphoribosyltransferase
MTDLGQDTTALQREVISLVRLHGLRHWDKPRRLSGGQLSRDYVDGKVVTADGEDLATVCRAVIEAADRLGASSFTAVGGLTMGADAIAHGVAMLLGKGCCWFSVRKTPKGHGLEKWIEGGRQLDTSDRVLLVDDVVTQGKSIHDAYDRVVKDTGAKVVAAVSMVDRGEGGTRLFRDLGIPYASLVTYRHLGIDPIEPVSGSELVATAR